MIVTKTIMKCDNCGRIVNRQYECAFCGTTSASEYDVRVNITKWIIAGRIGYRKWLEKEKKRRRRSEK
jgi:RNA polymerase subunit RPABC4/transcription elongation factor Spt4